MGRTNGLPCPEAGACGGLTREVAESLHPAEHKEEVSIMSDILTVDARGLACPQPVLETKKVFDEGVATYFTVLVDNPTSKENVSRAAESQGWEVADIAESGTGYKILIKKA